MSRIILRECGILCVAGQTGVCGAWSGRDGYCFYSHQAWEGSGSSEYRLSTEGRLLSRGLRTRWRIDDLTDTGRTAETLTL